MIAEKVSGFRERYVIELALGVWRMEAALHRDVIFFRVFTSSVEDMQ